MPPCRRYGSKLAPLRQIFSEFGLIKYRVLVECQWLLHLSEVPEVSVQSAKASAPRGDLTSADRLHQASVHQEWGAQGAVPLRFDPGWAMPRMQRHNLVLVDGYTPS